MATHQVTAHHYDAAPNTTALISAALLLRSALRSLLSHTPSTHSLYPLCVRLRCRSGGWHADVAAGRRRLCLCRSHPCERRSEAASEQAETRRARPRSPTAEQESQAQRSGTDSCSRRRRHTQPYPSQRACIRLASFQPLVPRTAFCIRWLSIGCSLSHLRLHLHPLPLPPIQPHLRCHGSPASSSPP